MIGDATLACPHCGERTLPDDEFCEGCGASLAQRRRRWDHVELDHGDAAGVSDRGLVHSRNEDAIFVEASGRGAVAVVCDGVSTASAPDRAAQVAVAAAGATLREALVQRDGAGRQTFVDGRSTRMIREAIGAADAAVRSVPWLPDGGGGAPACTIVAALWDRTSLTIGWTGDSRAYWLDADAPACLTVDHSWSQEQISAGRLTAEEADADSRAHAITRWLGEDAPSEVADALTYRPRGPGRLVICSDGLWNHAPSAEALLALVSEVSSDAPAIDVARALTRAAIVRGAHDNVTVGVIDVVPDTTERSL